MVAMAEQETHPRIQKLRERKQRHKQRSKAFRLVWLIVGIVLLLAGMVLSIPLVPGPGFLLIFVGLAMLALEFDRVERLVEKLVDRVDLLEESAKKSSPLQRALDRRRHRRIRRGRAAVGSAAAAVLASARARSSRSARPSSGARGGARNRRTSGRRPAALRARPA